MPLPLVLRTATVLVLAAVSVLIAATPSHGLSCAVAEVTPEGIAADTDRMLDGSRFLDHYDFAVIGTVTGVRTDERQGSPTYGATEIDVTVAGVLGTSTAPETTTLRAGDPGWMVGYPFQPGTSYFIPVVALSPEGVTNWTFACDPVSEVVDAEASAAELGALADGSGIAFATPGDGEPPSGGPSTGSGSTSASWFVPAISIAAISAAGVAVLLLRRRPLRVVSAERPPDGALVAVGDGDQRVQGSGRPA